MSEKGKSTTIISPLEQSDIIWQHISHHNNTTTSSSSTSSSSSTTTTSCTMTRKQENKIWPHYKDIMDDITQTDYTQVLECPYDLVNKSRDRYKEVNNNEKQHNDQKKRLEKTFCAHGVIVKAKIELFKNSNEDNSYNERIKSYTGLLTPGHTIDNCIMRLSTAMKPPATESNMFGRFFLKATGGKLKHAKLFPMVALKVFRDNGIRSGNLLFAGSKIGQKSKNFFDHCLCTQMTEKVPTLLKPFIRKFYSYSENPLSLGISDFCSYDEHGSKPNVIEFPYVVILKPVYNLSKDVDVDVEEEEKFDAFIDDLLAIPSGSVLFDMYACPDPSSALESKSIQRIGRITSISAMMPSQPDDGVFFRHQKKEEDFNLRPHWREEVNAAYVSKCGHVVGTIGTLVGASELEAKINERKFVDFEYCPKLNNSLP